MTGILETLKYVFIIFQNYVSTIGVLGAGLMGAGIAQVSVDKGMKTILKVRNIDGITRGINQVQGGVDKAVKRKKINKLDGERHMSNLVPTTDYDRFKEVDMVIEAVFEDISLKHKVVKEVRCNQIIGSSWLMWV